jgi:hypothetical protein
MSANYPDYVESTSIAPMRDMVLLLDGRTIAPLSGTEFCAMPGDYVAAVAAKDKSKSKSKSKPPKRVSKAGKARRSSSRRKR